MQVHWAQVVDEPELYGERHEDMYAGIFYEVQEL